MQVKKRFVRGNVKKNFLILHYIPGPLYPSDYGYVLYPVALFQDIKLRIGGKRPWRFDRVSTPMVCHLERAVRGPCTGEKDSFLQAKKKLLEFLSLELPISGVDCKL